MLGARVVDVGLVSGMGVVGSWFEAGKGEVSMCIWAAIALIFAASREAWCVRRFRRCDGMDEVAAEEPVNEMVESKGKSDVGLSFWLFRRSKAATIKQIQKN